jgi:hypothetical protein
MRSAAAGLLAVLFPLILPACATDLGTGNDVLQDLAETYPITVGRLVSSEMDTRHRLRVYLEICEDADAMGPVCSDKTLRILALVEGQKQSVLERISDRYLHQGREKPIYVYGPVCEGLGEMIVVPRCQIAKAISVWDPTLEDYVVYSTEHGSGSFLESNSFQLFLDITGRAAGIAKKAAR